MIQRTDRIAQSLELAEWVIYPDLVQEPTNAHYFSSPDNSYNPVNNDQKINGNSVLFLFPTLINRAKCNFTFSYKLLSFAC